MPAWLQLRVGCQAGPFSVCRGQPADLSSSGLPSLAGTEDSGGVDLPQVSSTLRAPAGLGILPNRHPLILGIRAHFIHRPSLLRVTVVARTSLDPHFFSHLMMCFLERRVAMVVVVVVGWRQSCSFLASQARPAPHPRVSACTRAHAPTHPLRDSRDQDHTPQPLACWGRSSHLL